MTICKSVARYLFYAEGVSDRVRQGSSAAPRTDVASGCSSVALPHGEKSIMLVPDFQHPSSTLTPADLKRKAGDLSVRVADCTAKAQCKALRLQ
jgi:hypothetical protein